MAEQPPPPTTTEWTAGMDGPPTATSSALDPITVWDSIAADFYRAFPPTQGQVGYGPLVPGENELRLVGTTSGRRVLDLGCGAGFGSVALAKSGAHVTAVDFSARRLDIARRLAEREEVRVEFRHTGLSELIFIPADSIDIVVSSWAIHFTQDWARVFRAVSRVLAGGGIFVFSVEHPLWTSLDRATGSLAHTYRDGAAVEKELIPGDPRSRITFHSYTLGGIVMLLMKEGFTLHQILEPPAVAPPTDPWYKAYPPNLVAKLPPVLLIKCEA